MESILFWLAMPVAFFQACDPILQFGIIVFVIIVVAFAIVEWRREHKVRQNRIIPMRRRSF